MTGDQTYRLRVLARRVAAVGVVELSLGDEDGLTLPAWEPGAHVDLVLGPDLIRQYSLCGDPDDRCTYRISVLHVPDGRGGSAWVHERLTVGTRVAMRGPRNNFELADQQPAVFIAGGIGITPILPMVSRLQETGVPWHLHYGGRSWDTMATLMNSIAAIPDTESRWRRRTHPGRSTLTPRSTRSKRAGLCTAAALSPYYRPSRMVAALAACN